MNTIVIGVAVCWLFPFVHFVACIVSSDPNGSEDPLVEWDGSDRFNGAFASVVLGVYVQVVYHHGIRADIGDDGYQIPNLSGFSVQRCGACPEKGLGVV